MSDTITALPLAATIDASLDWLAIDTTSLGSTQRINRNTYLNLGSAPVGLTDSQTLTNKVLTSPTISGPTLSGTIVGTYTIGGTPTFPSSVATLTGTQTLTNKVLTSPTINSPTITNATITADAVSGFTSSNNGTIYGIAVTSGVITGAGTVGSGANATNGVQAAALATNAITLGYTQITGNITTASTTQTQATGLTSTVTIPNGSRRVKITVFCNIQSGTNVKAASISIWDGVVGFGTQLNLSNNVLQNSGNASFYICQAIVTPGAGSKTYNFGWASDSGGGVTATMIASITQPAFILVETV